MIKLDFSHHLPENLGNVHFVGIGGAGMSGIARLFLADGIPVTGSDQRLTETVEALQAHGIRITIGHSAENIGAADTLVVTGAIAEDNPELVAARALSIPILHRAQALAWLTGKHRLVAVAGAHGKTTSTAMIVTALIELDADPSFVNGGVIRALGVSAGRGEGEIFVVEADESDGSFLLYDTAISLVTNVDPDHLDHYGSEEAFERAFVDFAGAATERVVISSDDTGAVAVTARLAGPAITTFGQAATADVRVHSVQLSTTVSFGIRYAGVDYYTTLLVAGLHNAINAAGAFGVLVALGYDPQAALEAIALFAGTERRFELRGVIGRVSVYDDFAHHPTEIRAALSGARGVVGNGRLIVIFQPHLFTRTRDLAGEFAAVLESLAEHTVIVPIYGARQDPLPGVSGDLIAEHFIDRSRVSVIDDWQDAVGFVAKLAQPGDFIIPMGGGDVHHIIPRLLTALEDHVSG